MCYIHKHHKKQLVLLSSILCTTAKLNKTVSHMWYHTPVALASSPSTSAVQTGLYHVQVTTWSAPLPQYLVDDVQLLADS